LLDAKKHGQLDQALLVANSLEFFNAFQGRGIPSQLECFAAKGTS